MFTPIEDLPTDQQIAVLHSLDAPDEWERTWDIGLTDPGDAYPIAPLWGRSRALGRWPAAFPIDHPHGDRSWRSESHVPHGHGYPLLDYERSPYHAGLFEIVTPAVFQLSD